MDNGDTRDSITRHLEALRSGEQAAEPRPRAAEGLGRAHLHSGSPPASAGLAYALSG
jgi:hypothetical protein